MTIHYSPYDLFGEIPVLESDIELWVTAVAPRWLNPQRSYDNYVQFWNVPDKIRAAKLRGTFHATIEKAARSYHARLALSAIV